jgi:hypothetical protein
LLIHVDRPGVLLEPASTAISVKIRTVQIEPAQLPVELIDLDLADSERAENRQSVAKYNDLRKLGLHLFE